jgi:hypothetical protein
MSLDAPIAPTTQDQADPETARAEFDAALSKSVREWAAKAKEVEAVRLETMALRETNDAIEDLRRLRQIGMEHAERTSREGRDLLTFDERDGLARGTDPGLKFNRIARTVRQIVVLQQELLGNRPVAGIRAVADAPTAVARTTDAEPAQRETERSDLADRERPERNDLYDYDDRSFDQAVDGVRQTLGVSAAQDVAAEANASTPLPVIDGGNEPRQRTWLNASASPRGANARGRGPP